MPIELYNIDELNSIGDAAVKVNLPELDPAIEGSFIRTLVSSTSTLVFAAQRNIEAAIEDFFPQTASGEFLDFWAGINALTRVPGTVAEGRIAVTGTLATSIPLGTLFVSSANESYTSTTTVTISAHTGSVALTKNGTKVTAVTPVIHSLVDSMSVTISGATTDPTYNGTFSVTVLDEYTFEYTKTVSDATENGSYSADFADIPIASELIGSDKNLSVGALLTLQSTVAGIDAGTQGEVNRDGITGGADIEGDESLRERVLLANAIDPGIFTNAQIRLDALTIPTASRVFITNPSLDYTTDGDNIGTIDSSTREALTGTALTGISVAANVATATLGDTTGLYEGSVVSIGTATPTDYNGEWTITGVTTNVSFTFALVGTPGATSSHGVVALDVLKNIPQPGTVYVFVLDDDNDPPTPSSTTLTNVKDKIIIKLPAHTPEDSVVVTGPFFESVDVTITGLSPDTSAMRSAVQASLSAVFEDTAGFAEDIKVNQLIAAIQNTQDLESGQFVEDFSLTSPSADTSVGNGAMGVLGTVTFA